MITATDLLIPARTTREGVASFAPMVTYCPRQGQIAVGLVAHEDLATGLHNLLHEMRERLGPARWIATTLDAFVQEVPAREALTTTPGDLEAKFAAGDGRITEQLVVTLVTAEHEVSTAAQTYRQTASDGWEWDEPVLASATRGAMATVLLDYL